MIKNNKGFAITTVLYGLSILGLLLVALLMATMSSTRKNSSDLVRNIERELNNISKAEVVFSPLEEANNVPRQQEFFVGEDQDGFYKIELWGSQGGTNGGRGAYTSGVIYLKEGERLYFYVGKAGSGNATFVRWKPGAYSNTESIKASLMVAAGGGSSEGASGGTLRGFNNSMNPLGGLINTNGDDATYGLVDTTLMLSGYSGYNDSNAISQNPSGNITLRTNGGGDGYYSSNNSNLGGVSYIYGYAGSRTYVDSPLFDSYFIDGQMYPGVHIGGGKAKVTKVSEESSKEKIKKSTILKNNIQYIRDCSSNATQVTFSVMSGGVETTSTINYTGVCAVYNLGSKKNVDEIAVWHNLAGKDILNHTVAVSDNNSNWKFLKNSSGISETETITGFHFSAYQSDPSSPLVNGDYYIIPLTAPNKCISASTSSTTSSDPLTIQYLDGTNWQKWKIEKISDSVYKILELARYKAMAIGIITKDNEVISTDENIAKNYIYAFSSFQSNDSQKWKITSFQDGTYIISTILRPKSGMDTGNIMAIPRSADEFEGKVIIAKNKYLTQRFKLVSLNYGSD